MLIVVLGHLAMSVIDRDANGALRGINIIELYPRWEWLTMLSPMPLFFVASGWANSTSSIASARSRVRTLVGLGASVAAAWSVAALVERIISGDFGIVDDGARLATQPLWFLTAWVPFTIGAGLLTRVGRRAGLTIVALLTMLLATDLARFSGGAPRWIGFPGFFAAWSIPWILGVWWRQRHDSGEFDERRAGVAILAVSAVAAAVLVHWFGYRAALIDAVPRGRSNTTPPTLFTAVASCVQVGALMIVAQPLDRAARKWREMVARLGAVSGGVYAWHLTALALCAALLSLGVWTPERLTVAWWLSRPPWFAAVLALTAGFVGITQVVMRVAHRRPRQPLPEVSALSSVSITIGTTSATVGAGLIGLYGPRNVFLVLITPLMLTFGWFLLRE